MQERAKKTIRKIVEAAGHEFAERGFQAATTKTVAARAEVSVGSVYRYFSDKSELLYEVASRRFEMLLDDVHFPDDISAEDLPEVARRTVEAVLAHHRRLTGIDEVLTTRRRVDPKIDELATQTDLLLVARTVAMLTNLEAGGDHEFMAFNLLKMIQSTVIAHIAAGLFDDARFIDGLCDAIVTLVRAKLP